ncbi:MAG: aspartyl/glutamyl-tRNA amidotransferase subunit C [Anaerolineae bacterium]|nr:aspartyl/glutamyl-tRNA amidotransferase subunit C [Gemmatimonadaceae bacterium]
MAISRNDVLHIAGLARLELTEDRIPSLVDQLNGILGHMEVISQTKVDGVCGSEGVGDAGLPLRKDVGPPYPLALPPESFAPSMREGFFIVPRLATHQDAMGDQE